MKMTTSGLLAGFIVLLGIGSTRAQDHKDQAEGMQEAMKAAMPGPVHEQLAKYAGEYTTTTKMWMQANGEPTESHGKAKLQMVLGGRFLHEESTGSMMGRPYDAVRILGYNNANKRYEGIWSYTMSTGLMTLHGTSKDDGKTIDWQTSFTDTRGQNEMQAITRFVDEDHLVMELIAKMPDGSPGPRFETTYTRKK
jgi:hypothetical protein